MLVRTTALGRSVEIGDWRNFHADNILRGLFDVYRLGSPSMSLETAGRLTGLSPAQCREVCAGLKRKGLAIYDRHKVWFTTDGLNYVMDRMDRMQG